MKARQLRHLSPELAIACLRALAMCEESRRVRAKAHRARHSFMLLRYFLKKRREA